MRFLKRALRHFSSPGLLLSAFLLFGWSPVFQVSCGDHVTTYTGLELAKPDGPIGSKEEKVEAPSDQSPDEEHEEESSDSRRARHLRWALIAVLALGGAGSVVLVLVFPPRAQGLVGTVLGLSGWGLLQGAGSGLLEAIRQNPSSEAALLPAWDRAGWLFLGAAAVSAAVFGLSFRRDPPEPLARWSGARRIFVPLGLAWERIRALPLAVRLPLGLALVGALAFQPALRWYRILFVFPTTSTVQAGCLEVDSTREDDDTIQGPAPRRKICIQNLEVDRYEATLFRLPRLPNDPIPGPCPFQGTCAPDRGDYPAFGITWRRAETYCRDKGMRLPTIEEWEYLVRGSRRDAWPLQGFGDGEANFKDTFRLDRFPATSPVGSFKAGPYGLHDMVGNMWEWTSTCRDDTGGRVDPKDVARLEKEGSVHCLVAGGSWRNSYDWLKHWKSWEISDDRAPAFGVRCVK